MMDLGGLNKKNSGFSAFNIKTKDFLLENDAALRVKTGIIYIIVNLVNGKVYVGLSRQTFRDRYEGNWASFSGNKHLKKAAEKYGRENFAMLIMEGNRGLNILNILETYYILKFRSNESKYGYNKTTGGDNGYMFSQDVIAKATRTKNEFISLAKIEHGDKYNYDQVNYKKAKIKVKIYCNLCKEYFNQTPASHLTGKGCRICGLKSMAEKRVIPFEKFIEKTTKTFGNQYIFYKESYTKCTEGVKGKHLTCGTEFIKPPVELLRQVTPCPKCENERSIENARGLRKLVKNENIGKGILEKSFNQYVEKLKYIHGDLFTCLGYTTKIASHGWNQIIIKQKCNNCKQEFLRERRYLNKGCPKCNANSLLSTTYAKSNS